MQAALSVKDVSRCWRADQEKKRRSQSGATEPWAAYNVFAFLDFFISYSLLTLLLFCCTLKVINLHLMTIRFRLCILMRKRKMKTFRHPRIGRKTFSRTNKLASAPAVLFQRT